MDNAFIDVFESLGAIIRGGHFSYSSGFHGSTYINKKAIFKNQDIAYRLCREIAARFKDDSVQTVIGPAVGGAIVAQLTAQAMTEYDKESQISPALVHSVRANKAPNKKFIITGEFDGLIRKRRVLIVEDVLNTGASLKGVADIVREINGVIVGAGALFNRGGVTKEALGVPKLYSLIEMRLETWPKDVCTMCKENIPINTQFGRGI